MFGKNEHSNFEFKQVFSVNKFELANYALIPLENKFNPENEFETQVFNDNGLFWSEINIMKKFLVARCTIIKMYMTRK